MSYKSGKRSLFIALGLATTFTLAFLVGLYTGQRAEAADMGYRFRSSSAAVSNGATGYSSYVSSAAADYNATDLTVSFVTNSTAIIHYTQGNYGATNWEANAVARNINLQNCSDFYTAVVTGNCNTTDRKAYYATIYLNSYYYVPDSARNWLTRHELGHVFGMGHLACDADAVMRETRWCSTPPSSLRPYDISLINSWY